MEVHIVIILFERGPGLKEHLPELVFKHGFHIFFDLGLCRGCSSRIHLVDGAGGQAVQCIFAAEERASGQVLDLLGLCIRVGNLKGEYSWCPRAK